MKVYNVIFIMLSSMFRTGSSPIRLSLFPGPLEVFATYPVKVILRDIECGSLYRGGAHVSLCSKHRNTHI